MKVRITLLMIALMSISLFSNRAWAKDNEVGQFYRLDDVRDAAYDHRKRKLYLITGSQLITIDTRKNQVIKRVDLKGDLRVLDHSARWTHLAIGPSDKQCLHWVDTRKFNVETIFFKPKNKHEVGVYDLGVVARDLIYLTTFSTNRDQGGSLMVCDPKKKECKYKGGAGFEATLGVSDDGYYFALTGGTESNLKPIYKFDVRAGKRGRMKPGKVNTLDVVCAPKGQWMLKCNPVGEMFDANEKLVGPIPGAGKIRSAEFHPKAAYIYLLTGQDKSLHRYDMKHNQMIQLLDLDKAQILEVGKDDTITEKGIGGSKYLAEKVVEEKKKGFHYGKLHMSGDPSTIITVFYDGVHIVPVR